MKGDLTQDGVVIDPARPKKASAPSRSTKRAATCADSVRVFQVAELRYRRLELSDTEQMVIDRRIRSAEDAALVLHLLYGTLTVEHVGILMLNAAYQPLGHAILAKGTSTSSAFDPSELARYLALSGAVACILFHNHPSGDAHFSESDLEITKRVATLAALVGVTVLDHLLLTRERCVSMANTHGREFLT